MTIVAESVGIDIDIIRIEEISGEDEDHRLTPTNSSRRSLSAFVRHFFAASRIPPLGFITTKPSEHTSSFTSPSGLKTPPS